MPDIGAHTFTYIPKGVFDCKNGEKDGRVIELSIKLTRTPEK